MSSPEIPSAAPAKSKGQGDHHSNSEQSKQLIKVEHKHTGAVTLATYAAYYSSAFGINDDDYGKLPEDEANPYRRVI